MNIHIFDANILTNVLFLGIKKVSLWISWVKNFTLISHGSPCDDSRGGRWTADRSMFGALPRHRGSRPEVVSTPELV
jgi:hypothetical protein